MRQSNLENLVGIEADSVIIQHVATHNNIIQL